jgi:hypothetical protein
MWIKSHSKIYKNVSKENIWLIWSDVNNWPKWDKELEYCKMDHSFVKGTQFILKPKSGPKVKITLSEVMPHRKFTDYCKFPGAIMVDDHELEETPEGVRITNTITVKGLLSFIWVRLVAKNVAKSIPINNDALVDLARTL